MSKCRPKATDRMLALETSGVTLRDITEVVRDRAMQESIKRDVVITIPYQALRDNADVQVAFQDLVTISTTP